MALNFAIRTIFEIAGITLLLYGFCHEDKLIYSEWHESQTYICTIGGHRFFA